jgi:capsular exopolysaccharide synthesis family protein
LGISLTETAQYRASAEIVFAPSQNGVPAAGNPVSFDPARDVQTEVAVLTSAPVRRLVATALKLPAAPPVTATAVLNTNAIYVSARSPDAALAARVANAYANAYVDFRKTRTINSLLDAEQLIQARITDIQHQIDALDGQISAAPAPDQATLQANLTPQRSALLAQQGALKQQLDQSQLQSALANSGAQLGSSATTPTSPASPHPVTSAVNALILGLFAGVALAFGVDFLDDSVKSADDAERAAFGLTVIGLTPSVAAWKTKSDALVVSLSAPTSPAAEAYRSLRTAVQFATLDRPLKILQVTSPSPSEGKTTTLANLAVAFARGGTSVCAVDGDLRRPRIHSFFGTANVAGLTSVAQGAVPLSQALQPSGTPNLTVLAAGPSPVDPSELLASARTKGVLTSLANRFDLVLIDSPPALPVTDGAALSRHVDGVLIVVEAGRTKKRALTRAVKLLRQVDAPILGIVLNRADAESRYGYSYDYSATPAEGKKHPGKREGSSPRPARARRAAPASASATKAAGEKSGAADGKVPQASPV